MLRFRFLLQLKHPVHYFCQEEAAWIFAPIFSPCGSVLHCVLRGLNHHVQFNLSTAQLFTKSGHRAWPSHRRSVPPGNRNRSRHRAIFSMERNDGAAFSAFVIFATMVGLWVFLLNFLRLICLTDYRWPAVGLLKCAIWDIFRIHLEKVRTGLWATRTYHLSSPLASLLRPQRYLR